MRQLRIAVAAIVIGTLAAVAGAQQIPRKAGEWTIQTPGGKPLELGSYKGKIVVLAFILTTCPHCQKTIGVLSKLQPEYGPRGVQVLASAVEPGARSAVPGFVKTFHPPFPVGYNEEQAMKILDFWQMASARVPYMPVILVIDRQGNVRYEHDGKDEAFFDNQQEQHFRREIDALLKK